MAHDHNHDHEERELITLVDEQGNETLFEILLTIDGKEGFGKNYVLLIPANAEEDENGEVEIQAYSFTENEDGTEGDLQPIQMCIRDRAHPEIAFTLINDGKEMTKTVGTGKLRQAIAGVYGLASAKKMVAIENRDLDFEVTG